MEWLVRVDIEPYRGRLAFRGMGLYPVTDRAVTVDRRIEFAFAGLVADRLEELDYLSLLPALIPRSVLKDGPDYL